MRKITLELVCELSDEELLQRASDLSAAIAQYEDTENRRKDANKDFKEELDALRQTRIRLSRVIGDRAERRAVECGVLYHTPVQGTKRVVRLDTGEYLRDEPMAVEELQQHLFTPRNEPEQLPIPAEGSSEPTAPASSDAPAEQIATAPGSAPEASTDVEPKPDGKALQGEAD